jgi:hypothetical protein
MHRRAKPEDTRGASGFAWVASAEFAWEVWADPTWRVFAGVALRFLQRLALGKLRHPTATPARMRPGQHLAQSQISR